MKSRTEPRWCQRILRAAFALVVVRPSMSTGMAVRITGAALAIGFFRSAAAAEPLCVPFDFSRGSIGLHVNVKGVPLFMILDTGVDPSVIDLSRADALGLKVDRAAGGEATGGGDAKQARAFPVTLSNLTISGRPFASFDALAMDMGILSEDLWPRP